MRPHHLMIVPLLALSAGGGAAAQRTGSASESQASQPAAAPATPEYAWITPQALPALKRAALARAGRAGSGSAGEELLSEDFKAFRGELLAVRTGDDLERLIQKLDAGYDRRAEDVKFVAAQLVPLRAYRGVVHRLVPLVSRTRITHSFLLTAVRQAAASMRVYLPTEQWEAAFAYVTEPFGGEAAGFTSEGEVQGFLANEVYRENLTAARRLAQLDLQTRPVVWDNRLWYGTAAYPDNLDRYRLIGPAEREAALSAVHGFLAWIAASRAYDADGLLRMTQELGMLYGIDGFNVLRGVEGAPFERRAEVMRQPRFAKTFTLRADGRTWMALSSKHLRESVYRASLAWHELKDRPASETAALDPGLFTPWARPLNLSLATMEEMVQGPAQLRSFVTGETVVVNLPAFYETPPADLKALLPSAFEQGPDYRSKSVGGKSVRFRNYLAGRPVDWDLAAYRPYFPQLARGSDVAKAGRILFQAWGGGLAGVPLALFVQ